MRRGIGASLIWHSDDGHQLDEPRLASRVSQTARVHLGVWSTSVAPVYVVIHEIAEENWVVFGRQADLATLRASAPDALSI